MTTEINRIIEEAKKISVTLSDGMIKSIIKYTFTEETLAPKSIDPSFVKENLEYILKKLEEKNDE